MRKYNQYYTISDDKKSWTYDGPIFEAAGGSAPRKKTALKLVFLLACALGAALIPGFHTGSVTRRLAVMLPYGLQFFVLLLTAPKLFFLLFGPDQWTLKGKTKNWIRLKGQITALLVLALVTLAALLFVPHEDVTADLLRFGLPEGAVALLAFLTLQTMKTLRLTERQGRLTGKL